MKNKLYTAFTLLELIMVIVIVGIMVAVAIPKMDKRVMIEAADQVVAHIRYAQHLAMVDDKFDPTNPTWYLNRWSIGFNNQSYSICFNQCNGAANIAKDPKNPIKFLSGNIGAAQQINNELDLRRKYNITNVVMAGGCQSNRIAFDKKGRPYCYPNNLAGLANPASGLITNNVTITLTNSAGQNTTITMQPETGFIPVLNP